MQYRTEEKVMNVQTNASIQQTLTNAAIAMCPPQMAEEHWKHSCLVLDQESRTYHCYLNCTAEAVESCSSRSRGLKRTRRNEYKNNALKCLPHKKSILHSSSIVSRSLLCTSKFLKQLKKSQMHDITIPSFRYNRS